MSHHHHTKGTLSLGGGKGRRDSASEFKERSLRSIAFRRKADKWLKISLFFVAILMIFLVIAAHLWG